MELLDALEARSGIVCAVGAGGKKSTLYRLLAAHPGRVGITASVMTAPPSARRVDIRLFDTPEALDQSVPAAACTHRRVAFARASEKSGRVAGLPVATIADLHQRAGFDVTLVKADGARMRGIKAPRPDEPVLVPGTTTCLYVISAGVIGQPLNEDTAHRLPELCALLDAQPGETLTPTHIGRLISHPEGGAKTLSGARRIALINQVDNPDRARLAKAAAIIAMQGEAPPDRVVLGCMMADNPIVDIVDHPLSEAD